MMSSGHQAALVLQAEKQMMNGKKRNIMIAISGVVFALLLLAGISLFSKDTHDNKDKMSGIEENEEKEKGTSDELGDDLWVDGTLEEDASAETDSETTNHKPSSGSTDDSWSGTFGDKSAEEEVITDNENPSQSDESKEEEMSGEKEAYLPIIPPEYD